MGQVDLLSGKNHKKSNHMGNGFIGDFLEEEFMKIARTYPS